MMMIIMYVCMLTSLSEGLASKTEPEIKSVELYGNHCTEPNS